MTPASNPLRLGFLGAGRMATALASGLVDLGLSTGENVIASDPLPATRDRFVSETHCRATPSNLEVADAADILVLAVKPQYVEPVLVEIRPKLAARHLVISIAAGVRLAKIAAASGGAARLVRVMPNTPCLAGMGAAGYCLGPGATPEDGQLVARMLGSVGRAFEVKEALLDAVTGLSGSGPAFVYAVIEALSDGGVLMGLPRDVATALAAQTVKGAAEMVLCTGKHPGELKDEVASPGGTTIAGLAALERGGLRAALIDAVEAATRRSQELGQA
jgi:pyrroline-5-carboxylate reductase